MMRYSEMNSKRKTSNFEFIIEIQNTRLFLFTVNLCRSVNEMKMSDKKKWMKFFFYFKIIFCVFLILFKIELNRNLRVIMSERWSFYSINSNSTFDFFSRCLRCLKFMNRNEQIHCEFGFDQTVCYRCADNKSKCTRISNARLKNEK